MMIAYRPGYCPVHPGVKCAPGEKYRCLACVEQAAIDMAPKPATKKVETSEPKKPGRKPDPNKAAEKAEKAAQKTEKEALKAENAILRAQTFREPDPSVPVLVIARGMTREAAERKASQLSRSLFRGWRIDFLPRSARNSHDSHRAAVPDIVLGPLAKSLDPEPYAVWTALDPDYEGLSPVPEEFGFDESGNQVYFAGIPDSRNPSRWRETDMCGAEVLDLRNYPQVLTPEVKGAIAEILRETRGWMFALRNSSAGRLNKAIYRTVKEGSLMFYALREMHNPDNVKREDPPVRVQAVRYEQADRSPIPMRFTRYIDLTTED